MRALRGDGLTALGCAVSASASRVGASQRPSQTLNYVNKFNYIKDLLPLDGGEHPIHFTLPPDFPGGGVANVPGILMKSNEQARGTPLAGLAVKVTDGFFLVGLSNVDADRARNLQLLKERSWFDVPLV